eukprot:CAMPEP_0184375758 /NCGR_PEP_ID=MMETSP0007-20130409/839_1 /TAXON_ID=97485 /ORGANISM="Prymnesium parvum, Strain Texoma1" /LENGTH=70 /DNA_ID=CAMNT_0026719033 /DNA_START=33 /DNA_END=242 /DNA_ORIENTATION=+
MTAEWKGTRCGVGSGGGGGGVAGDGGSGEGDGGGGGRSLRTPYAYTSAIASRRLWPGSRIVTTEPVTLPE